MDRGYAVHRSDLRKHEDLQSTVDQASDLRFFPNGGRLDIRVLVFSLSPRALKQRYSAWRNVHNGQKSPPSLRALALVCSAIVLASTLSGENAVIVCLFVLVGAVLLAGASR